MKAQGKRSKGMRAMAAAFALAIGLTSFNGLSAWAGKMKKDTVKKEYTTADIDGSLVTTEKKAVRTGDNAFDVTLSVTGQSFDYDKQVQVKNTDFVFVVDTSASMNEDGNWNNLKTVLGDEWTYSDNASLVNNILGKDKSLGNTVTFVGYNGNRLINSSSDYYISDKFTSDNIRNAIEEYSDYNKMSGKIKGNTAGGNIIAGFRGARKVINSMKREGRNQIAVLLTDGNPSIVYRQLSRLLAYIAYTKACFQYRQIQPTIKTIYFIC